MADPASAVWQPDWPAIAHRAVVSTLGLQRGERVIYLGDPGLHPGLMDAVRGAVLDAGGIEQATILAWSPALTARRTPAGHSPDPELDLLERRAHWELFATADVFLWLPPTTFHRAGSYTTLESEWIVDRWRGRSVHLHWAPDPVLPAGDPVNAEIERMGERAILELDYAEHAARQHRILAALRGSRVTITTPAGTELSVDCPEDGWYYANDGAGGPAVSRLGASARDRTQELPCGAIRTIPGLRSATGIIRLRDRTAFRGSGFSLAAYSDDLDLILADGRLTHLVSATHQDALDTGIAGASGDWDLLAELVIGTNPLIHTPAGASFPPFWGYQAGLVRLFFGDNSESGGPLRSTLSLNTFLQEATVIADGRIVLDGGVIVV